MPQTYDTIIIGGACAGLSAGLYASRRNLKTLVITKDIGGQIATTTTVENYPGAISIEGSDLAQNMKAQAETSGAEILIDEVTGIEKKEKGFLVKTSNQEFSALTIILAFGLEQRKINVPGEKELTGRGVAYCATCDGPFYRNKVVAVVGGGNSAVETVDYLAGLASKVYVIVRKPVFRAEPGLVEAIKNNPKVEILFNTEIKKVIGEKKVESLELFNNQTNEVSNLELNGVFVEIGWQTKTEVLQNLVSLDERGYVVIDNESKTSTSGVFAAGDITDTPYKQAVISAGEGAKAALSAAKYLQSLKS